MEKLTPLQQIENGIKQRNWQLVNNGFEELTGRNIMSETLEADTSFSKILDNIDADDYKILEPFRQPSQSAQPVKADEKTDYSIKRDKREVKNKEVLQEFSEDKKICRKEPIDLSKSKLNLFHDDKSEFQQDTEIQKKISGKPVKRIPKYKTVDMTCTLCGKSFSVNPIFARDNYKCDRCLIRSKPV